MNGRDDIDVEEVVDALIDAFRSHAALRQMLEHRLGESLDERGGGESARLRDVTFNMVRWFKSESRLPELINGAYIDNPGNLRLQKLAAKHIVPTPYLPNYDCDIFVSAAEDVSLEWLSPFLNDLKTRTIRRLKRQVVVGHTGRGEDAHRASAEEGCAKAAILIAVVSPGYLTSECCRRELESFLGANPEPCAERLNAIEHLQVERASWPAPLRRMRSHDFTAGAKHLYYRYMDDLVEDVEGVLDALKDGRGGIATAAGPRVFLGEVTPDLRATRQDLERYLTREGTVVLPDSWYPADEAAFRKEVEEDLARCEVFVQLLGTAKAAPGMDLPADFLRLQHSSAEALGKTILQWRREGLSVEGIADAGHRALLEGRNVRAESLEVFKRAVKEAVFPKEEDEPPYIGPFIFVNTDVVDRAWVRDVVSRVVADERLAEKNFGYLLPLHQGQPDRVRSFFDSCLKYCHAMLIIYGSAEPNWVLKQLTYCRKKLPERDEPLRALALYDGPPPEKEVLEMFIPDLTILNCRKDEAKLVEFLERL